MPLTYVSLAQLLKSETLFQHEAAEQLLYPKLSGITSLKDYSDLLKTFYGFFGPLEKLAAAYISPGQLPDINERKNASRIIDDLQALGENVFDLSLCMHLPQINNNAQAFGAMYVMEGSSLGGRMIRKMLMNNHGDLIQPEYLNYFNGYGEATSSKWKTFQESLEKVEDHDAVVQSANNTFTLFQNWIKHSLYDKYDRA